MVKIRVNDYVKGTDYYKKLLEWEEMKSPKSEIGEYIDINILDINDDFIILYFNLINDFKEYINYDCECHDNLYEIMSAINDFLHPLNEFKDNIFPFEIAAFLIKNGYKEHFMNDTYYLALLYETPEVYNRIVEDEYYRNNHDEVQELIHLNKDTLIIDPKNHHRYKKYTLNRHEMSFEKDHILTSGYNNISFFKLNTYDEVIGLLREYYILNKIILDIISMPNVAICGGYVNSLIHHYKHSKKDNIIQNIMSYANDIDIFFYGDISENDILDRILLIINNITIRFGDYDNFSVRHSKNSVEIMVYMFNYGEADFKIQIIKRVYKNISQILLGFDLDSAACSLYSLDDKIYVSYLPRYKFAVENRMNIINPYRQSLTYNYRLMKYMTRGYSVFIPGAIHTVSLYYSLNGLIPTHTLQEMLYKIIYKRNYISEDRLISISPSDYSDDYMREIFDYVKKTRLDYLRLAFPRLLSLNGRVERVNDEDIDIMTEAQKRHHSRNIENYVLDFVRAHKKDFGTHIIKKRLTENVGPDRTYGGLITRNENGSLRVANDGNNRDGRFRTSVNSLNILYDVLKETGVAEGWNIQDPGTQISGSFNPTNYNYLYPYNIKINAGKENEEGEERKMRPIVVNNRNIPFDLSQ